MTPHLSEEFSTGLIDWNPFMITGSTMPPRDPDEDDDDEDDEDEDDDEDDTDGPPGVREPDAD